MDSHRPKIERELEFGPEEMWWKPTMNSLPEVLEGNKMPSKVIICDETLREGEETPGVVLDMGSRLDIARKLEEVGVPEAEVGYVGAIPEHAEISKELKREGSKLQLVSHTRLYTKSDEWKGELDRAVEAGSDILCLLASMSETLCATTPWLPKAEVPTRIVEGIEYTKTLGATPALTLVDGIRTPLDEFLLAYEAAAGADVERVYIMDGQGVALPETIRFLTGRLRQIVGDDIEIAVHCHDDYGFATANTIAALRSGASVADVVVNGLGDKAGIGALEEVVMTLEILYGVDTGVDITKLYELSRVVQEKFDIPVAANKSIVGPNIVRHQIDSHIATVLRGFWWAWEEFKPELLGRERSLEWARGKLRLGRSGSLQAKLDNMGIEISDEEYDIVQDRLFADVKKQDMVTEAELETIISEELDR